ncbi:MAG TPA: DUF4388 domain-containing protein [Acidimicrobiales bacterium]|nr:DUF4388 domain-containing protein [Acidimicrobiales bacterium]
MSLNGTLETFALPDVLALLAATRKTGELQVNGGRGDARVWLENGEMVGADVPRATTFVDALFEMLRFSSGNFVFDNDGRTEDPADPEAVEPLLLEAQSRLGEWKSIEEVVPSLACGVTLAAEVSGAKVSITAEQWRTLVAVAVSRDVEGVMSSLGLGEFSGCRMLKDLVQIGLIAIEDAPPPVAELPAPAPPPAVEWPVSSPVAEQAPVAQPEVTVPAPPPRRVNESSLVAGGRARIGDDGTVVAPAARGARSGRPEGVGADPEAWGSRPDARPAAGTPAGGAKPGAGIAAPAEPSVEPATAGPAAMVRGEEEADKGAAGMVHELAQLQGGSEAPAQPAQPDAVATAASLDDDVAPAADDPAKGEEPLNRGLLLKFLNSVRS